MTTTTLRASFPYDRGLSDSVLADLESLFDRTNPAELLGCPPGTMRICQVDVDLSAAGEVGVDLDFAYRPSGWPGYEPMTADQFRAFQALKFRGAFRVSVQEPGLSPDSLRFGGEAGPAETFAVPAEVKPMTPFAASVLDDNGGAVGRVSGRFRLVAREHDGRSVLLYEGYFGGVAGPLPDLRAGDSVTLDIDGGPMFRAILTDAVTEYGAPPRLKAARFKSTGLPLRSHAEAVPTDPEPAAETWRDRPSLF